MSSESTALIAVPVDFPLRGEWVAYNTPAWRVPTHGTDDFGQRYAYDFLRVDFQNRGWKFYGPSELSYYLRGVALGDCFAWGQPIHAPFDGVVVTARDGWPERDPVHFVKDITLSVRDVSTSFFPKAKRFFALAGNHVIIRRRADDVFALIAHVRTGSVRVREGEEVRLGQPIAAVGHSGSSSMPHLHFQLMDGPDPLVAEGLACSFVEYEVRRAGSWVRVEDGVPAKRQLMRSFE